MSSHLLYNLLNRVILTNGLRHLLRRLERFQKLDRLTNTLCEDRHLRLIFTRSFSCLLGPDHLTVTSMSRRTNFAVSRIITITVNEDTTRRVRRHLNGLLMEGTVMYLLVLHDVNDPSHLLLLTLSELRVCN